MTFWKCCCIQRSWLDSGYMLLRQCTEPFDWTHFPLTPQRVTSTFGVWVAKGIQAILASLGDDFKKMLSCSVVLSRQWIHALVSVYGAVSPNFTHFLRHGGLSDNHKSISENETLHALHFSFLIVAFRAYVFIMRNRHWDRHVWDRLLCFPNG